MYYTRPVRIHLNEFQYSLGCRKPSPNKGFQHIYKNIPQKAAMEAVFGECEISLGEKMLNKQG